MHAARMYNIVRFCPGRLLGQVFVTIPASPSPGVGTDRKAAIAQGLDPYRRDGGEAKTRRKR